MKRRLYFIAPNKRSAKEVERDPLIACVDGHCIRCIAKSDSNLEDLPRAGPMQTNDLTRGIRIGLLAGGLTGAVCGLLVYLYADLGIELGWVLAAALIGATFGIFAASLVAASAPSKQLKSFERELEDNKILLMIDVPKKKIEQVLRLIIARHPEIDVRDADTTIPALP
jgi:uncharacterized membrane protein